jgi:fumarate hydratase subunit beta
MPQLKTIQTPLTDQTIANLYAGEMVLINGLIYSARDAAHKRMVEAIIHSNPLPISLANQIIYYVGPAPAKPGQVIGPAGPTTSGRMDPYTPALLKQGVKGLVGKGYRSTEVKLAMTQYRAVYFATIGGAAALLAQCIKASRIIAYAELGAEAIHEFVVENFPVIVVNDIHGNDAYISGRTAFTRDKSD